MTFDPTYVDVLCATLPKFIVSKSHGNTIKYVDTVTIFFFRKLNQKVNDPKLTFDTKMTFDPFLLRSHVWTLPKDHCIQVP